jgi:uncharacterized protein (DUF983 family)
LTGPNPSGRGSDVSATDAGEPSLAGVLLRGLRGRCPRCGRGALFAGYLRIVDRCSACGLGFGGHDVGDGAIVFVIFILGFAVVAAALAVEVAYQPPLWLHAVLWGTMILGGTLALLRPAKGITVALQYRFRSTEEPPRPGGI